MKGKAVILSVLIMSLVMAEFQVEAKICCPTPTARHLFDNCISRGVPLPFCSSFTGCPLFSGNSCPPDFPANSLKNSAEANVVNEYCKLGCTSSVCDPLTTRQNSGSSEIGDGAVEQCAKACSTLCTNGYIKLATETA